jgi:hypothetical protein
VLGDLTAGEIRDVVVPLKVVGRRAGATVELMDATLSFEDATAGAGALTRIGFAKVRADCDPEAVASSVKVAIETARARARAAGGMPDAIARARAGDLQGALGVLDEAIAATRIASDRTGDPDLVAQLADMETLRGDLPELAAAAQRAMLEPARGAGGVMPSPAAAAPETVERRSRAIEARALDSGRHR